MYLRETTRRNRDGSVVSYLALAHNERDPVTLATDHGQVAQRGEFTPGQRAILRALALPEPPRFFDFTPTSD